MNFEQLAVARYSVRKFSEQPIEKETLDLVLQVAQNAPTAHNDQPQRVFVFQSPEALEKVKRCTPCHFNAPVIFAIGADIQGAWVRECDGKNSGEVDAAIVTTQMMLQAADLGLGTTWVGMFDPLVLKAEFPQLEGFEIVALLPMGYPSEAAKPSRLHTTRKDLSDMVSYF